MLIHKHYPSFSKPRLSWEREGPSHFWNRYLALDSTRIFHIGTSCNTCEFFFTKLNVSPSLSIRHLSEQLEQGNCANNEEILSSFVKILPADDYIVAELNLSPELISIGSSKDYFSNECAQAFELDEGPHNPGTPYYRCQGGCIADKELLMSVLVPLQDMANLDEKKIEQYCKAIEQGGRPVSVVLSVLDIKNSTDYDLQPQFLTHWCLANYLIDGHHKIAAAAQLGCSCTVLSFLSRKQSFGNDKDLYCALEKVEVFLN